MQFLDQQLVQLHKKIRSAEEKFDREENSVKLLAVCKTRSAGEIAQLVELGQLDMGENYQQEAQLKQESLQDENIIWHFIGPIQSNKTAYIAEHFSWIHSVDRLKLARRLSSSRPASMPDLNICLQVNISNESSKSGITYEQVPELANDVVSLPGLKLRGIMALPAPSKDFDSQRLAFKKVRRCFDQLRSAGFELDTLSMGTSTDMDAAIAEGATIIRIGTALFGPRAA